ncbi:MAG TPA: winged helix-turn-helix transcriptional regulator [Chthoniobacterales bacterium]|nr:winged helix-turn-helix transcriptional regulator [Chthoniobacterales bacterium]
MKRISEVGRSQRMRIIDALKKTQGLSVNELGQRLKLSYMGIKQHCDELERTGYVDTWRRPKPVGRPEMVYRLTEKAHVFYPSGANAMTIELLHTANRLYGHAAGEKLLYSVFGAKTNDYIRKMRGNGVLEQAETLAKIRNQEGYMSEIITEGRFAIVEYHSPIFDLLEAFPLVRRLEREMVERVLGTQVEREEEVASGLYRCSFVFNP